jgi:ribosomal protein S18 acetylase RimI-like enzyme
MPHVIRSARAQDHAAFVRLFAELGTDDVPLDAARFTAEMLPSTLVATNEHEQVVGYAYAQWMDGVAYVRGVVTAPEARRTGVARHLMQETAARARAQGCHSWCLNVKPDNHGAIALYNSIGLERVFDSTAMRLPWKNVPSQMAEGIRARRVEPDEDAQVELTLRLVQGQMSSARRTEDRVILMLESPAGAVLGGAVFHPHYPGAYPFAPLAAEHTLALLQAIRPHAGPSDPFINLMIEGLPEVVTELGRLGATVRLHVQHLRGPLP